MMGSFNQLFPADAPNDPKTFRQEFDLLKQVNPNGEIIARICMMGYTRAKYGNLWSVFNMMAANLTAKEAEYIIDKVNNRETQCKAKKSTTVSQESVAMRLFFEYSPLNFLMSN